MLGPDFWCLKQGKYHSSFFKYTSIDKYKSNSTSEHIFVIIFHLFYKLKSPNVPVNSITTTD